jgi:hypothetical protein
MVVLSELRLNMGIGHGNSADLSQLELMPREFG